EARAILAAAGDPAKDAALARVLGELDLALARGGKSADEVGDLLLARRTERRSGFGGDEGEARGRPVRAGVGVPRLHAAPRGRVAPRFSVDPTVAAIAGAKRAPAPPPKPTTLEELRAAKAAGASLPKDEDAPAPAPVAEAPPPVPAAEDGELAR